MPVVDPPRVFRVRLTGPVELQRRLLAAHQLEPQSVQFGDGSLSFDAFVSEELLEEIKGLGLRVEAQLDLRERALKRPREDSQRNRFEKVLPEGLGKLLRKGS